MSPTSFDTPVLFLVFNRPEKSRMVFEAIRRRKPKYLYVAADGPRVGKPEDEKSCESTRRIVESVDWDCEVKTLFRDVNLGCRRAVQGALDWFFEHVEEGIILEDDTLPDDGFFDYCASMLERYRNDENVFSVNGCNFGYESADGRAAFTAYFFMWGWASWRRSNVMTQRTWGQFESRTIHSLDGRVRRRLRMRTFWDDGEWLRYWERIFSSTAKGEFDTWDYQWLYTALHTGTWCIRPSSNRVVNIGFDGEATHTSYSELELAKLRFGKPMEEGSEGPVVPRRDRKYENQKMARIWIRYNARAKSRLYRMYLTARNLLMNK